MLDEFYKFDLPITFESLVPNNVIDHFCLFKLLKFNKIINIKEVIFKH